MLFYLYVPQATYTQPPVSPLVPSILMAETLLHLWPGSVEYPKTLLCMSWQLNLYLLLPLPLPCLLCISLGPC